MYPDLSHCYKSDLKLLNKIDGLIYSSEQNDTLLESLKVLVSDSNLISDFGNAGRQDALTRFNQELNFGQILELLVS